MFQNKNQSIVLENDLFKGLINIISINYNLKNFNEVKEGTVIYKPGEQGDFVYLIIEGEVKVKIPNNSGIPQVLKKTNNQYFGEKEILEGLARKSSSVADTDCLLYFLPKTDFLSLVQSNDELRIKFTNEAKDEKEDSFLKNEFFFKNPSERITDLPFFKTDKIDLNKNGYSGNEETQFQNPKVNEEPKNNNEDAQVPNLEETSYTPEPSFNEPELLTLKQEIERDPYDYSQEFNVSDPVSTDSGNEVYNMEDLVKTENSDNMQDLDEDNIYLNEDINNNDSEEIPQGWNLIGEDQVPEVVASNENKEQANIEEFQSDQKEEPTPDIKEDVYIDILVCIEKICSSFDLNKLFINIPSSACHLISASSGTLYIHDDRKREFFTIEDSGSEIRIKDNEGLPGLCYINQDIISFENDDDINSERNVILFPIENMQRELVSILQINDSHKGFFDETDKKIIKAIIPFIANTIENALQFNNYPLRERLNALGLISGFLVNDIKPPLMKIKHYTEFLKQKFADEDSLKVLNLINDQSGVIIDFIETTKDFSDDKVSLRREEIEVSLLMDDFLILLAEYTESRKVKVFRKYEGQGSVNVDKKKLFQAFYQVVKNACDAMPYGGNIYFLIKRNDPLIEIEIKDEGIGVSLDIQEKIFDHFFSYGKPKSAGLGLTLANTIIKKHDGSIRVLSADEAGSIFIISLPAADIV